jgi:hypothetical protein
LPVVLSVCETLSLTLRKECKLRVFENIMPKRGEVTGEWRRLHNADLYALCSSLNVIWVIISRMMRWAGHVPRAWERRGAYGVSGQT